MKKKKALITGLMALSLMFSSPAMADYGKYYQNLPVKVNQVAEFTIPSNTVSIEDFGGVGDGVTLNTEAFAKAIDALAAKVAGTSLCRKASG